MVLHRLRTFLSSVNRPLLKLKLCYFFTFSVFMSTMQFVWVMPAQMVSYEKLAIIYGCSPLVCIGGPILTGFIGDRIGNYKVLTVSCVVLVGLAPFGILWLFNDHQSYNTFISTQANRTGDPVEPVEQFYTFPLLLVFRLIIFYGVTSASGLLDAAAITVCKKHNGDFGRQKLWSRASIAVIPFICGLLVDFTASYFDYHSDAPAFYVGAAFAVMVIPLILQLDMQVEKNKKCFKTTVKEVSGMIDLNIFILVSLVVGMTFGFHNAYRAVFATELQASKTLIGVMLSASGLGNVLLLGVITLIIEKIGEANLLVVNLMLFGLRAVIYYFLHNPLIMAVIEVADGLCGFTATVAGSYYCAAEAPPGMLASLNGIVVAVVFGAGRGIGTGVGSVVISKYGIRTTYLFSSCLTAATGVIYFIVYHLFLKPIRLERRLQRNSKDGKGISGIENSGFERNDENST